MKQFRFLDWKVYRDAKKLLDMVLGFVRRLPKEYRFELGSQVVRSGFSVVLNIAEGSGKSTDKDLARYFDIALGSLYEILASLGVFRDHDFVSNEEFDQAKKLVEDIAKQLGGFKNALK